MKLDMLSKLVGSDQIRSMEEWEKEWLYEKLEDHEDLSDRLNEAPLSGSLGLRRELANRDMEYFARAYFPEYIPGPAPDFHKEMYKDLQGTVNQGGGSSVVRAAPRGHAKTTLWDFILPLWCILYKKKEYILILSDSSDQANGFITNIKEELEHNERIHEDFGNIVGEPWATSKMGTQTGVRVEALGAGMKVRGRRNKEVRPDLIICDDLENDENSATPEQRKKLKLWFQRAVRRAGAKYTDFVVIGTVIHDESLLSDLLQSPGWDSKRYAAVVEFSEREDLWEEWKTIYTNMENQNREKAAYRFFDRNRKAMLEGTSILWEKGNPNYPEGYYSLMKIRLEDGEASFWSELQNDPKSSQSKFFQPILIRPDEIPPWNSLEWVISVDPSLGQSTKADTSALIALARDRQSGQEYVPIADISVRTPDVIIRDLFIMVDRIRSAGARIRTVVIETVQFQALFSNDVAKAAMKASKHLPISKVLPRLAKDIRIESIQPSINNGYVKISENAKVLIAQLEGYPKSKKDGPDALHMAIEEMHTTKNSGGGLPIEVIGRRPYYDW